MRLASSPCWKQIWPLREPSGWSSAQVIALEGELAGALILDEDVGGFHHVGIVVGVAGHLDDAPAAQLPPSAILLTAHGSQGAPSARLIRNPAGQRK